MWLGALQVIDQQLTVGELVAFNMLAGQVSSPILRLAQLWNDFQQVGISMSRLGDILNAHGVIATTRRTRGDDIDAACGQLVGRVHNRTTVRLGSKLVSVAVQS